MKKLLILLTVLFGIMVCAPAANAAEAMEISGKEIVTGNSGMGSVNPLFDGRTMESINVRSGGTITLSHQEGIGSLYLVFGLEYSTYTATDKGTGDTRTFGENGFLHQFLDLEATFGHAPEEVMLTFDSGDVKLAEIHVFTSGEVPGWVQKWEKPLEGGADLVLFSTHGDDEQLFFTGMLPYYAGEMQYGVQVVYMTGHRNMSVRRSHEMLDGLWAVGVTNYPVFGPFGDYNSTSKAAAYQTYRNKNISRDDILSFVVENVRRFRPKVAVGHDLDGEYGHGMHMIYAELLCEAAEIAMDREQFPESAETYGVWDIPKTYLHLYPENQIRMNWDIPLESFDGMTAYEVTKELGFPCHVSQQSYYSYYFSGKHLASEITVNSPCEFGLYRSTVGEDVLRQDFFENLTTYAQDAQAELRIQEEIARAEAEKATEPEAETYPAEETEAAVEETQAHTEKTKKLPEPAEEAGKLTSLSAVSSVIAVFFLIFGILGVVKVRKQEK